MSLTPVTGRTRANREGQIDFKNLRDAATFFKSWGAVEVREEFICGTTEHYYWVFFNAAGLETGHYTHRRIAMCYNGHFFNPARRWHGPWKAALGAPLSLRGDLGCILFPDGS